MVKTEVTNIRVIVRVRPNNTRELEQNQRTIINVVDTKTILFDPDEDEDEFFFQGIKQCHRDITKRINKKLTMEFDRVFDPCATNEDVFADSTKTLVASVMDGYNCSVFVYGATGAGKTFTMLGNDFCPGITFLTMAELFRQIANNSDTRKFDIGISYLEVYNEQVINLLTKVGPLKLREDVNGVVVSGLVLKPIYSADELLHLLRVGNMNRTQHPTDANSESSRSHAVFQVHIRMTDKKTGHKRTVKLSMIDLAGSERAASTKGIGVRFKEGASINKSLLALGNCINKLADGSKHIPYRDSNLTRILKDSLGGNCKTVMIANVSPSSLTYEDTYNTLKYASRARKIRTGLRQNVMKANMPKDYYVKKVSEQQEEIERLQNLMKDFDTGVTNKIDLHNIHNDADVKTWHIKIDGVFSNLIKAHEYYYNLLSREKAMTFKKMLKQNAENIRKRLYINDSKLNEDLNRLEASIDRHSKQIAKEKEELNRWHIRLQEYTNDLTKLRKEVEDSKLRKILEQYMNTKEGEVALSKANLKLSHVKKINDLYYVEYGRLFESFLLSFEIIQPIFNKTTSSGQQDPEFLDIYNKLIELNNGQLTVRFKDETDGKENLHNYLTAFNFNAVNDFHEETPYDRLPKRPLEEDFRDFNNEINYCNKKTFIGPKNEEDIKMNNILDETRVINVDGNSTFAIPRVPEKRGNNYINIALSEQNVNASNHGALTKALSKNDKLKQRFYGKVTISASKENQKFSPNKIRKSPRPSKILNRGIGTSSIYMNRKRTKSTKQNETEPIIVRANRAANFRLKNQ